MIHEQEHLTSWRKKQVNPQGSKDETKVWLREKTTVELIASDKDSFPFVWARKENQKKPKQPGSHTTAKPQTFHLLLHFSPHIVVLFLPKTSCFCTQERLQQGGCGRGWSTCDLTCTHSKNTHHVMPVWQRAARKHAVNVPGYFARSLNVVSFSTCRVFIVGDNGCETILLDAPAPSLLRLYAKHLLLFFAFLSIHIYVYC